MNNLYPLRSVWFRPAETIAFVAHQNPGYRLFALPIIAGFASWPTFALFSPDAEDADTGLVLASLVSFGPVIELFQVFIGAYLIRLTGAWLGGKGQLTGLQAAIAWGNVPIVALAALGFVSLIVGSAYHAFTGSSLAWHQSLFVTAAGWLLLVAQFTLVCWALVIFLRGVARVQGYSLGYAVVNALLAWMVPALVIVIAVTMSGYSAKLTSLFFAGFGDLVPSSEP